MRVSLLRITLVVLVALGAGSCESEPTPASSRKAAEVAAPPGLVAELTIPEPRRFWTALRKLGGSRAEFAPSSFELALFFAFDMPPRVAGYLRQDTPVVGVILAPPGAAPAFVLAVRTARGSELVRELTRAEGGFHAERDGLITLLIGEPEKRVLGVVDDWLVAGSDRASLRAAALYLARTLGSRRPPEAPLTLEVKRTALGGPLLESARTSWAEGRRELIEMARAEREAHGRTADFADPESVLAWCDGAVGKLADYLASTERLTVTVRPEADRLELRVSVVPQRDGALARSLEALEVGALQPLLDAPESVFAVLSRSSETERSAAAESPADALRSVLGSRLPEKDAAPLADAFRSIHRARGSVTLFGILESGGAFFFQQDVRDPREMERGVRSLLRMARVPAIAQPLEPFVGKIGTPETATKIAGIEGSVSRLGLERFGRRGARAELLVQVRGEATLATAGEKAREGLVGLTTGADTLGSMPGVAGLAEARPPATLALYADLAMLLLTRRRTGPGPALAVLGKRGNEGVLKVALSATSCASVLERLGTP